ncbi:MAG: hypothetical protein U0350_14770 [Caldilineaceae bacterium]
MDTLELQAEVQTPIRQAPMPADQVMLATTNETYCETHPTVATWMRCNKCNRLICLQCAVQTPVGYRCKACVRTQQNVYFNAKGHDDLVALLVSFVLAAVATPILGMVSGSLYFYSFYAAFIAGPGAGMMLVQLIRWTVGRRRSRTMQYAVALGVTLGVLVGIALAFFVADDALWLNLPLWIFAFLVATTAYQGLR